MAKRGGTLLHTVCTFVYTQMELYIYVHYALEHPSKIEVCNCVMKNIPPFLYMFYSLDGYS